MMAITLPHLYCTMRQNTLFASLLPGERCDEPAQWYVWTEHNGILYQYACPACLMALIERGISISMVQHVTTHERYTNPTIAMILGNPPRSPLEQSL